MFHVCFNCGRSFPSVNALNVHLRERCVRCGCAQSCAWRWHGLVCQRIVAYECYICSDVFFSKEAHDNHMHG